jgi:hypothetical protein
MSTKKNIIAKKRITLGTKQFVPMFEQFLNESMEEEDEDMKNMEEIEEGGGDEDVEMESEEEEDMDDSGEEGSDEEEETPSEEEIEERIQEAYRRGLAKGKKLARINEDGTGNPVIDYLNSARTNANVSLSKLGEKIDLHYQTANTEFLDSNLTVWAKTKTKDNPDFSIITQSGYKTLFIYSEDAVGTYVTVDASNNLSVNDMFIPFFNAYSPGNKMSLQKAVAELSKNTKLKIEKGQG